MRLFEAIIDANHRALGGDTRAGLHPSEFPTALPVIGLSCIDPRLNRLLPEVLGVPEEDFIWLRNAGNIIFDPLSSMMRTLSLACAVKGGKEIAIIGHSDCRVAQTSVSQLLEKFRALGIERSSLPDNLVEFFGLFSSERQNVINGVNHIRKSPLISHTLPVHGLIVDVQTGRLEWLVNGYEYLETPEARAPIPPPSPLVQKVQQAQALMQELASFDMGQMKFPEVKIGDLTLDPNTWLSQVNVMKDKIHERFAEKEPPPSPVHEQKKPSAIPIPPPIKLLKRFGPPKKSK